MQVKFMDDDKAPLGTEQDLSGELPVAVDVHPPEDVVSSPLGCVELVNLQPIRSLVLAWRGPIKDKYFVIQG